MNKECNHELLKINMYEIENLECECMLCKKTIEIDKIKVNEKHIFWDYGENSKFDYLITNSIISYFNNVWGHTELISWNEIFQNIDTSINKLANTLMNVDSEINKTKIKPQKFDKRFCKHEIVHKINLDENYSKYNCLKCNQTIYTLDKLKDSKKIIEKTKNIGNFDTYLTLKILNYFDKKYENYDYDKIKAINAFEKDLLELNERISIKEENILDNYKVKIKVRKK